MVHTLTHGTSITNRSTAINTYEYTEESWTLRGLWSIMLRLMSKKNNFFVDNVCQINVSHTLNYTTFNQNLVSKTVTKDVILMT